MDASFEQVQYGFQESACSPTFAPGETGIKLTLPESFDLSARDEGGGPMWLPLCITLKFDELYLSQFQHYVFQHVEVIVVDVERNEMFSGHAWRDRHYVPPKPNRTPPEVLKQRIGTHHNTVNLLEHVRLPLRAATYRVSVTLGTHRSNIATLRTRVEPPAP